MENSNMETFPSFNYYADATPQMETSRKGPGADSTPSGKDTPVTSSRVTPMDQPPTRKCISPTIVHFQDSLSNQFNRLLKSQVQGNRLTGLSHQFNTDFCCDEKRNDRDLHRNWNNREQLSNTTLNTTSMATIQVIPTTHKEVYLLLRPLKTMAHQYRLKRKKPTLFQDHQNSNCLMTQKLRSSEVQQRSGNQDKNTADSQKQKKLSFKPHSFIMMIETLSGTILLRKFHLTLST